jgi:CMP-N,N'-diacetyllegionaminic acid synthase
VLQVLAVIAARGGSKTLPRKNVALLGGRPLIAWTIEAARDAATVSRTVVTTEDPEIAEIARRYGADVPFVRPAELARDETPGTAPVVHAVRWLEANETYVPDLVANLQPTSPYRTAGDIDAAVALLTERRADTVVSVTPVDHHPFWMKRVDADGWMHDFTFVDPPIVRRQDLPPVYRLNGALYLARRDVLLDTGGWYTGRTAAYVMPFERSVDIDTAWDFRVAEMLLAERR